MAIAIKAVNNLDMNLNEIQNFILHKVAGDLTPSANNEGAMYYNTVTNKPSYIGGGVVHQFSVGGSYTLPAATAASLGGVIVETTSGLTISSDGKVAVEHPYSVSDAAKVASSIQGITMNGAGVLPDSNQIVDLGAVVIAVSGKIPDSYLPSYVDDVVEVANYSALPSSTDAESGKIYILLNDEAVGGVTYKANSQFRWSGSAWVEITKSIDVATTAEAEAGTDDTKMMTAKKVLESIQANSPIRKYVTTVGDGTSTSIVVTHNLNTKDVVVKLYEGNNEVLADVETTSTATVTLTFSVAPTAGQYRVVVVG